MPFHNFFLINFSIFRDLRHGKKRLSLFIRVLSRCGPRGLVPMSAIISTPGLCFRSHSPFSTSQRRWHARTLRWRVLQLPLFSEPKMQAAVLSQNAIFLCKPKTSSTIQPTASPATTPSTTSISSASAVDSAGKGWRLDFHINGAPKNITTTHPWLGPPARANEASVHTWLPAPSSSGMRWPALNQIPKSWVRFRYFSTFSPICIAQSGDLAAVEQILDTAKEMSGLVLVDTQSNSPAIFCALCTCSAVRLISSSGSFESFIGADDISFSKPYLRTSSFT